MRRTPIKRRWIVLALAPIALAAAAAAVWGSLGYQPDFYRRKAAMPPERRRAEARHFVSHSLQLRNDIMNEPRWEAAFSDEEVNAWLAEDLVAEFADQIPPGVRDPLVAFEPGRAILAFKLDDGPIRSLIWAVARVEVPEDNVVALTVEKIRAGALPVPAEGILDRLAAHARARGLDVRWERDDDGLPVAYVRYRPDRRRADVILERLDLLDGRVRLAGRSHRARGTAALELTLPSRRTLQATFGRRRKTQPSAPSAGPVSLRRPSTTPRI